MVFMILKCLGSRQDLEWGVLIVACVSGLASPGPMAAALWTDEELEADITLDAIVTVVDACHIARQLDEPREEGAINEAQEQVAYADVILLNKVLQLSSDPFRRLQNKRHSVLFMACRCIERCQLRGSRY